MGGVFVVEGLRKDFICRVSLESGESGLMVGRVSGGMGRSSEPRR